MRSTGMLLFQLRSASSSVNATATNWPPESCSKEKESATFAGTAANPGLSCVASFVGTTNHAIQHALIKNSAILRRVFFCYSQHGSGQSTVCKIRLIVSGRRGYFGLRRFTARWAGTLLVLPPGDNIQNRDALNSWRRDYIKKRVKTTFWMANSERDSECPELVQLWLGWAKFRSRF